MHIMSCIDQMPRHLHIHSSIPIQNWKSNLIITKQNKKQKQKNPLFMNWIGKKTKTQNPKSKINFYYWSSIPFGQKLRNYLGDSSCMSKTMTSNVIGKNEMFSGSWDSITFLLDSHCEVFGSNSIQSL